MTDEWVETTLEEVALVNPREKALSEDAPFITMADVQEWGVWAVPSGPKGERGGIRARGGDTLIARITPCLENGKIAMVPQEFGSVGGSTEFVVLRAGDQVLPEFLFRWATSSATHQAAIGLMTGTTGRQRVGASDLAGLPLLLPPLAVQRRIVDLMKHLDNQISRLREERGAVHQARLAALERWVADAGGRTVRLSEVLDIARGGSPRPIDDYFTDAEDGLNWIKIGDVPSGGRYITQTAQKIRKEGLSKTRQVVAGDFILSNSMSFGRPYILKIDGCIHDGWLVLSGVESHFDPDYLYFLLRSNRVQSQFASLAAGSGVKNLNIKVVGSVEVPVPDKPVQARIAHALSGWVDLEDALEVEEECLRSVRERVLGLLLSGGLQAPDSYDSLLDRVA